MRAIASESQGPTDYFASSVADFVKNLFVGKFRLRCDNEPSIMVEAEKVTAKIPDRKVLESTPGHSSASNGLELRSLRYDTQNRYKTRVMPRSAICHEW